MPAHTTAPRRPNPALSWSAAAPPLVLFATGSTGGHVSPALAVAEALREREPTVRTLFCGPVGGVAERMVASAGETFVPLDVHPLRGAGVRRWVQGLADLPLGAGRSLRLLRAVRPDAVVGTGNHTSGPLLALAALHGIPTLLFEANVDVGLANRWLGSVVRGAAVAWPQTLESFPNGGFLTGWPVRRTLRELAPRDTTPAEHTRVLILGGSAGASALDRGIREALPHLRSRGDTLSVVHQASADEVENLRERYRDAGIEACVEPFFTDLARHYRDASFVVTRSGGATLAELAAVGLPSILVPLAAAGNHQVANAIAWQAAGCARVLLAHEFTGERLAQAMLDLAHDRRALEAMRRAAKAQHRPDAAARLAEWCHHALRTR